MRVRMLTPEKLGRVYEVATADADDLIARGMAEAVPEPVMRTTTVPLVTREPRG